MAKINFPPIPVGYRIVNYELISKEFYKNVIYVMYIGDKFYIGRASNMFSRVSAHKSDENRALSRHLYGNKDARRYGNIKIAIHLAENIEIHTVYIDILEVCTNKWHCKIAEKEWIKSFYHMGFHDLLLNINLFNNYSDTYLDIDFLGDMMNTD